MSAGSCCDLCGQDVANRPWVLMNRFVIGSGTNKRYAEWLSNDGQPCWDIAEDGNEQVGGTLLCTTPCLLTWIEGHIIDLDFTMRREGRKGGQG